MNSNLPLDLNEEALSSEYRGKRSPLRFIIWFVIIVTAVFAAYHYQASLMAMIRRPAALDTAASADPGNGGGRGRGSRGGGGGPNATVVTALPVRKADMPIYLRGLGTV